MDCEVDGRSDDALYADWSDSDDYAYLALSPALAVLISQPDAFPAFLGYEDAVGLTTRPHAAEYFNGFRCAFPI